MKGIAQKIAVQDYCLLGGDIEFFAADKSGRIIPADSKGFYHGKNEAEVFGAYGKVFADGVQIEINFDPSWCRDGIIQGVVEAVCNAGAVANSRKAHLIAVSGVKMSQDNIDEGGYFSHVSGCNPDFSAYTDVPNRPIQDFAHHPIRTAGYHIQFGLNISRKGERDFAKLCDRTLGLISGWGDRDESHILRKGDGVGLAGCFRNHPSDVEGISSRFEYRTLGAWWVRHPVLSHAIFGVARTTSRIWHAGLHKEIIGLCSDAEVRAAINNCDNKECRKLAMRVIPVLAEACRVDDPNNSMSPYNADNLLSPLGAFAYILDGHSTFGPGLDEFALRDYGLLNWSRSSGLRDSQDALDHQSDIFKEIE